MNRRRSHRNYQAFVRPQTNAITHNGKDIFPIFRTGKLQDDNCNLKVAKFHIYNFQDPNSIIAECCYV